MKVRGDCWLYSGYKDRNGYVSLRRMVEGKRPLAHRYFYEKLVGEIPEGFVIDHLCRVRNCVNPDHLEAVTSRENTLRGIGVTAKNAVKTECNRGHSLNGENLYLYKSRRHCRKCRAIWDTQHPRVFVNGRRLYV